MLFTIFNQSDKTLYYRSDAESAIYTHEQYTLEVVFPYDKAKVLERGMRIGYKDADGVFQAFEIRRAEIDLVDYTQEVMAEHIALAELSSDMNEDLVATTTATAAVTSTLLGSLWGLGTTITTDTHQKTLSYLNKWDALVAIRKAWSVRFRFRVTVAAAGITGRFVDILSDEPVFRGVRLTLARNITSARVTYDDSNMYTAAYGLGKAMDDGNKLTFADTVWTTPTNPAAKPVGQKWVEDVASTTAYGRNGRKRTGYIEFSDIDDPAKLLTATWEWLQERNVPQVTFDTTVNDLSAYGYAGERMYLGDAVHVIFGDTGIRAQATIVQLAEDLVNPDNTKPVIGTYRPTMDVINRNTAAAAEAGNKLATANPDLLAGIIDTMKTTIMSSGTKRRTDPADGSEYYLSSDESTAVRFSGGGILLASTKIAGAWNWRTAITGAGIVANEISTGTLRASLVKILGNDYFYWDSANIYAIDPANPNVQLRFGRYDGVNYGLGFTRDGGATWLNKIDFTGAMFSYAFRVVNSTGKNLLSITEENTTTGTPAGLMKLGDTDCPVDLDNSTVWQPKNGGTGYPSGQVHRLTSIPEDTLGIDGDLVIRYAGNGSAYSAISPAIGPNETATRFGLARVWNYERTSGYRRVGNTASENGAAYWLFTAPVAGITAVSANFSSVKYIAPTWYGWDLNLPITVALFPSLFATTPLATGTFTPTKDAKSNSISLVPSSALTNGATYYIVAYDPSTSYNKSAALIATTSMSIPGSPSNASPTSLYVKVGGTYIDITKEATDLLASHKADHSNPHDVTASQVGAVPTSREVNGHALTGNVEVTAADVGAAPTQHAHGGISYDGKMGPNPDQFVITGAGGALTLASPGVARNTMDAQQTIYYGTTAPASPFAGQIWLKPKA